MVNWSKTRVALVCLAGLALNAAIFGPALALTAHGTTDFMGFYAGGKLAFSPDIYSSAKVILTEQNFEGMSSPTRLFMRLPVFSLVYWLFAQLKYPVASTVWEIVCVLSLLAFATLWPGGHRRYALIAICWSLPAMLIVAEGQDIGFVLLSIAAAFLLMRRKFPVAAGLIASLCLVKFHLFLMIPVWICARRQWRFARGLGAGCAVLLGLSFLPGGWNWPASYFALLTKPENTPYLNQMPTIYGLFGGLPHPVVLELACTAGIAFAVWTASRASAAWGLAAALAGGVLAAPHAYMADGALIVPALLLVFRPGVSPGLRGLCYILGSPILWVLLMCGSAGAARLGLAIFVLWMALGKSASRSALATSRLFAWLNSTRRLAGTDQAGAA